MSEMTVSSVDFTKVRQIDLAGRTYRNPVVVKLQNGEEIVVTQTDTGAGQKLTAYNLTATTGPEKWATTGTLNVPYRARPVVADLNNDGQKEIIAQLASGKLALINAETGAITNPNLANLPEHIYLTPQIKDLTGDGKPEVIAASYKSGSPNFECRVSAFNSQGVRLWSAPLADGLSEDMGLVTTTDDGRALIASSDKAYIISLGSTGITSETKQLPAESLYSPTMAPGTHGRSTTWFPAGNEIYGFNWRPTVPPVILQANGEVKDLAVDQNNALIAPVLAVNPGVQTFDGLGGSVFYPLPPGLQISKNVLYNVNQGIPEIFAVTGRYYPAKIFQIKGTQVNVIDTLTADDFANEAGVLYKAADGNEYYIVNTEGTTNGQGKLIVYKRPPRVVSGVVNWKQYE